MAGPKETNNKPPEPEPEQVARVHPWLYVIIPVSLVGSGPQEVIFAAFCKACRTYFTETMRVDRYGKGTLKPSSLPRYGCEPISEDVLKF